MLTWVLYEAYWIVFENYSGFGCWRKATSTRVNTAVKTFDLVRSFQAFSGGLWGFPDVLKRQNVRSPFNWDLLDGNYVAYRGNSIEYRHGNLFAPMFYLCCEAMFCRELMLCWCNGKHGTERNEVTGRKRHNEGAFFWRRIIELCRRGEFSQTASFVVIEWPLMKHFVWLRAPPGPCFSVDSELRKIDSLA